MDSAGLRRIAGRRESGWLLLLLGDGRHTAGRKNGRSRGTEPRRGSHASTPITRDSLTIGFPLAVTEIYRKPAHFVPPSGRRGAPEWSRFSHQLRRGGGGGAARKKRLRRA